MDIPLLGTSLLRRRRSLPCVLPIVLLHYGVSRLVTVMLAVKRLLLRHRGIPITGILPLIDR